MSAKKIPVGRATETGSGEYSNKYFVLIFSDWLRVREWERERRLRIREKRMKEKAAQEAMAY